jgi:hypothetical protein
VDSNTLNQYLSLFGQHDVEPLLAAIQNAASSNTGGVNDIYQRDINPPSLPCQAHLQANAAWGENTNLHQVAAPGFANQQVQQLLLEPISRHLMLMSTARYWVSRYSPQLAY